ncbi:DUF1883 domain-containing protein [Selenomonas ruminantium]|uniref:DUF1883 domain-containing protein n=1 Tax=Selenomonas ruminantium TaxID=971 RepID=UPI00047A49B4|nr:DUF1883 domain-containing protein [Selenomonas ruminantium]
MKFLYYDLGYIGSNRKVEVNIDKTANVILVDANNFSKYKRGHSFQYIGGNMQPGSCTLVTNMSAHWYVVVDLGGRSGEVHASCRILD